jgi:uroporphyrinogen-III decarboxylase
MIEVGALTPKERLLRTLRGQKADRPPVICPGGMMNAATVDVMNSTGRAFPDAHSDPVLMAGLAADVHEMTGFENLGIPFCLTVEAEVLGRQLVRDGVDIISPACGLSTSTPLANICAMTSAVKRMNAQDASQLNSIPQRTG